MKSNKKSDDKEKAPSFQGKMKFLANPGKVQPLIHKGKQIRITEKDSFEVEWDDCVYDTKVILRRAVLKFKDIRIV